MKKSNITQAKARINELMENTINAPTQNLNEMFSEAKKLDKVGTADADIDNDGDVDNSDVYLHNRRRVIKKSIKSEEISPKRLGKITVDTDEKRSIRAKMWRAKKSGDNASWNKLNAQLTVLSNTQKESVDEEVELDEAEIKFVIKHKKTQKVLSTHNNYNGAKDEHSGISDKQNYGIFQQTKKDAALRNRNTYREEVERIDEGSSQPKWSVNIGKKTYEVSGRNTAEAGRKAEGIAKKKKNFGVPGKISRLDELSKDTLYKYFKASYADEVERRGDAIDQKRSLTPAEKKLNAKRNLYRTKAAHRISPIPDEVKDRGKAGKRADRSDARMQFKRSFKAAQNEETLDEISKAKLRDYEIANEKDRERLSKAIGWVKNKKYTPKQKSLLKKLKSRNDMDTLASKKRYPGVWAKHNPARIAATEGKRSSVSETTELTEKSSFGKAFAAARAKSGGGHVFSWNGKKYTTNIKGETGTVAKGNYSGASKPAPKPAPTPVNKIVQGTNKALSRVTRPMPRTPTQGNNPSVTGSSIRPRANPRTAPIAKPGSLVPAKVTGPTPLNPGKSIARATAKALAVTPKKPNRTSTGAGSPLSVMGAKIGGNNSPTAGMNEAIVQGSKKHLAKLIGVLDKAKRGSTEHSQIRHAISSMFGDEHIPAKHRNVNEASIDYKVSVDGLPPMFIDAKNPMEIKQKLRKLLRKPDSIGDVKRVTKSELKKYFRTKGMGKDPEVEETKND